MPSNAARIAREVFAAALAEVDVSRVVRRTVRMSDEGLEVAGDTFDVGDPRRVLVVAIGKAALPMAFALQRVFDGRGLAVEGVVVSGTRGVVGPPGFTAIAGGHPIPDAGSLEAGREVLRRVRASDDPDTLIVFAISGGASAMCECPRSLDVTLDDLRATNGVLVGCGATIAEVNAIRRRISAIKGGGLAAAAPRAVQVSLFVSDVNPGDLISLGSGLTVAPSDSDVDPLAVLDRHELRASLPRSVLELVERTTALSQWPARCQYEVLLDNAIACGVAEAVAHQRFDLSVEVVEGLVESPVEEVAEALVDRLARATDPVCLVSGGEAVCPVRGPGRGGRNTEIALRAAIHLGRLDTDADLAVLSAGTDGIDGNSPAAGAWADCTTLTRAWVGGMRASRFLALSDSYEFFAALGDTLLTGPTGNNVRDLRIAVAIPPGRSVRRRTD
ncbi:MAG: DUF4147 domain-containing protein [Planctomycetes bacterium]|nr:DUF4147 domain-containing protein [Planctomycetota bacterium]